MAVEPDDVDAMVEPVVPSRHTNYDTLVFTSEDLQLTRRLVHG